ncbi:response regulator transcription factor [Antrihabitans cavernicola]|uniref:Response regulator transcription factor n=1 Tax=Antrihabitans cavernicola TaxID=2495913 RepID=A0A5A7SAB0_9NOCA|nr:response regulator transcription factor [Spelaeibacter cavernicola]KAA0021503.1 response regulator transcription factor [Spelaeibacter cavernicola]
MNILVADDDPMVREVVARYLDLAGFTVVQAGDGPEATHVLARGGIDLAVLDVMMPAPDGIAICRALRRGPHHDIPIILLTALGDEDDRVLGLEAGADDYVTKPFSPRELALRVGSVLRRTAPAATTGAAALRDGSIDLRPDSRAVYVDHVPLDLTAREFDLLAHFLANPQRVYSREELLAQVWGWSFGDQSTVTVHVKRLRAKLGTQHRIDTVWGRGYAWARADIAEEEGTHAD